jgi:ssDNA-binding Zn-finger/Zn-ribbon topoisomerase 1
MGAFVMRLCLNGPVDDGIFTSQGTLSMPIQSTLALGIGPYRRLGRPRLDREDELLVVLWDGFVVSGPGRVAVSGTTSGDSVGASRREPMALGQSIPFQSARDFGSPLPLVLTLALPPRSMPRKSLLDEFFSAGFSLLDGLFAPDSRKASLPDLGPSLRPSLRTPAKGELAERLRQIDWFQFEKLVGALYREKGYLVERLGGAKPDGGIDLILRSQNGTATIIVQCKHWRKSRVKEREIRELEGAKAIARASRAVMVTLRGFTDPALRLAAERQIQVLDEHHLIEWIEQRRNRPGWPDIEACLNSADKWCPTCESAMVERTVAKGARRGEKFWGCSQFPKCRHILEFLEEDDREESAPPTAARPEPWRPSTADRPAPEVAPASVPTPALRPPLTATASLIPRPTTPANPPAKPTPPPQSASAAQTTKICPRCQSPLVEREAKKGTNVGNRFLGCSSFPKCRHIEAIG